MPSQLPLARHLEGLRSARAAFGEYAERAGPDAPVPTCAGWTVRDLVAHQVEAERRTDELLRGPEAAYWARRSCHQATLRAVDALAAVLERPPEPVETGIDADLAVDGIDEVLTEVATRPTSRLRTDEETVLLVAPDDAPDWWLVRIGPHPAVTQRGTGPRPAVPAADWEVVAGSVVGYLALWERAARPMSRGRRPGPPLWSA